MRALLSARFLESAKAQPGVKPFEIRDIRFPGLILRVQPKGSRSYVIQYARGQRKTLGKVEALDADDARDLAKRVMANVAAGRPPDDGLGIRQTQTLTAFLDGDFKKHIQAERPRAVDATLARLKAAFSKFLTDDLTALTADRFEHWKTDRLASGTKPATVARDLAAISGLLSRAVKLRIIPSNPVLTVDKPKLDRSAVIRFLSEAEEGRLRAALIARDKRPRESTGPYKDDLTPAVLLSLNTGCRRGELLALRWRDVNLEHMSRYAFPEGRRDSRRKFVTEYGSVITIHGAMAKSGQTRRVPLNPEARATLRAWKKQTRARADAPVFNVRTSFKTAWRRLMKAAKIEGFRWHDMRHTFASRLVQRGIPLNTVRDLLGHASLAMTLKYAHLAQTDRQSAVDVLNRTPKR